MHPSTLIPKRAGEVNSSEVSTGGRWRVCGCEDWINGGVTVQTFALCFTQSRAELLRLCAPLIDCSISSRRMCVWVLIITSKHVPPLSTELYSCWAVRGHTAALCQKTKLFMRCTKISTARRYVWLSGGEIHSWGKI